jgi:hypothetical protein
VIKLTMPALSTESVRLRRSVLHWLRRSGDSVAARAPIAFCNVRLLDSQDSDRQLPLREEQNDLQVVLAPSNACKITYPKGPSKNGGQDMFEGGDWRPGEYIADAEWSCDSGRLLPLVLAGRRGFENGAGRGSLLAGWHEKVRGFWEGEGIGRFGTVLALGTCEQTAIFRGDDTAFLSWFARAPGPAQVVAVSDECGVHSSAVLLQHLRRTPGEARAILDAVYSWIGERVGRTDSNSFPGFRPESARGTLHGRWPESQDIFFAMQVAAHALATSPILERSEVISSRGIVELNAPEAVALTLGSEFTPHFRHRRTGWIVALHGFRFGPHIGSDFTEWLRRDFEPVTRTVADSQRDLAALADEVEARTGAVLLVQNLVSSAATDRVSNYAWLGDSFDASIAVLGNEANLMLSDLTRHHRIAVIDADALAAELGVKHCPDRFHASPDLVEAQRDEVHRVLREYGIPGF